MSATKLRMLARQYAWVLISIALYMAAATAVAAYILNEVRFRPPWEDITSIEAHFEHAQAVTPGQGQAVTIAGVDVGEVGEVSLEEGHAVVRVDLEPEKSGPVYRDATLLLRPKTLAQDQSLALDPGHPDPTLADRGRLHDGDELGREATQVNVNTDQVFAELDVDTREYLRILLDAGGQGLKGRGGDLRRLLEAQRPTVASVRRVTTSLAGRRRELRRLVTNFRKLSEAAAEKDDELRGLVSAASATFGAIGEREAELGAAVERLPGALSATRRALRDGRELAREAAPTLTALRPAARRLGPALDAARPLLRTATPILRRDVRPFVREAVPLFRALRPSLRDLNRVTPSLVRTGRILNYLANELGYNPPGGEEGYLFWTTWFAHNTASAVSIEDAHGAAIRGLVQGGCSSFPILPVLPPGTC